MKNNYPILFATVFASLSYMGSSQAAMIYTNNAGTPLVQSFELTDGSLQTSFTGSGSNGRGVVVVGDTIYTTDANTGNIGIFDLSGNSQGTLAITNGGSPVGGISTIGWDGDAFWTSDYTGSNNAYRVDPITGNVIKTIQLSESMGFYDGLEFFDAGDGGRLIANEFDGGFRGGNRYSIYDTDGNLITEDFIDTTGHGNGTGIAYDGIDFFISDIFNSQVTQWSGLDGSFIGAINLIGSANLIEDLSFDYEGRSDTCRTNCNGDVVTVPEPSSIALLIAGLFGIGFGRSRVRS